MTRIKNPHVCFLLPTCGRAALQPHLLNEAVYYFTLQDYPDCELLILNDASEQILRCDVPGVTVVNSEYRHRSLGEKMNVMVELATPGAVCAVYEDDDVILPWRASVVALGIRSVDFWSPGRWWYCPEDAPPKLDSNGWGYTSSAFRRESVLDKHRNVTDGHDKEFVTWALGNLNCCEMKGNVLAAEVAYCYRWGVSSIHLSGTGFAEEIYDSWYPGKPGTYDIVPALGKRNYLIETRARLALEV